MRPAELVLVAGPNGSGKSTVADAYIEERFPIWPKLNADRLVVADNSGEKLEVIALRHLGGTLELRQTDHPASQRLRSLSGSPVLPASS